MDAYALFDAFIHRLVALITSFMHKMLAKTVIIRYTVSRIKESEVDKAMAVMMRSESLCPLR